MTVKEAIGVLPDDADIRLVYAESSVGFHRRDPLMLDAYGGYLLDALNAFPLGGGGDKVFYELVIALRPVKA